jgi:hypothetical protein
MIMDKLTQFATALALSTAGAGTTNVGDVIDLGAGVPTIGTSGDGIMDQYLVIIVSTPFTGAGSINQFNLVTDSQAPPRTTGQQITVASTKAFAIADPLNIVGGNLFTVAIPVGFQYLRYIGIQQVCTVAALTAGSISAFITVDPALWTPPKAGI